MLEGRRSVPRSGFAGDPGCPPVAETPFAVGQTVQYWSDTHSRWIYGTVRTVHDNGVLDLEEFSKCVALCKVGFGAASIGKLFAHFDADHSGMVDYNEFLRAARGLRVPPWLVCCARSDLERCWCE